VRGRLLVRELVTREKTPDRRVAEAHPTMIFLITRLRQLGFANRTNHEHIVFEGV
jgi:hypothetical protein